MTGTPLGIQANNWCNIRFVPGPNGAWRWLAVPPALHGFCSFVTPDRGITVALRILRKHQADGAHSIAEQIGGIGHNHNFAWAPATENDTAGYVAHMQEWTGLGAGAIDLWRPEQAVAFLCGMVQQEVGLNPLQTERTIRIGVAMAPPRQP